MKNRYNKEILEIDTAPDLRQPSFQESVKDRIRITGRKVEVNSFKKSISNDHKTIYKKAAKKIGAEIIYSDSPLGDDWDCVWLVGDFSKWQENLFQEEVIRLTTDREQQQYHERRKQKGTSNA